MNNILETELLSCIVYFMRDMDVASIQVLLNLNMNPFMSLELRYLEVDSTFLNLDQI